MEKVNLTVIDKNPDIKNFVYPGVPKEEVENIKKGFKSDRVVEFTYDEGQVIISTSEIHTLVFSDYLSIEQMDMPSEEQE